MKSEKTAEQYIEDMKDKTGNRLRMMTEFFEQPVQWEIDERYTWLTPEVKNLLSRYEFDWGDIMDCAGHFMSENQICDMLMCTIKDLENYCDLLWQKPWPLVFKALQNTAYNKGIDMFSEWAERGNSAALNIIGHGIMRVSGEERTTNHKVVIVNDLDEKDK